MSTAEIELGTSRHEGLIRRTNELTRQSTRNTAETSARAYPPIFKNENFWFCAAEALHLAHLMAAHGYIFPIDDHILTVKNDNTYYRFQVISNSAFNLANFVFKKTDNLR